MTTPLDNFEIIQGQSVLIDQQSKLIKKLAKLIETQGFGHLLDNGNIPTEDDLEQQYLGKTKVPPAKTDIHQDCGPLNYGPGGPPVVWNGTKLDLVPISIGDEMCKGMIFDREFLYYWNYLLDLRRKLPRYNVDLEEENKLFHDCTTFLKKYEEEQAAGTLAEENEPEIGELKKAIKAAYERWNYLKDRIIKFEYSQKALEGILTRHVRGALIRSGAREAEGSEVFIEDLRDSKDRKFGKGVAAFDERFEDEELNEVPLMEILDIPLTAPEWVLAWLKENQSGKEAADKKED